MLPNAGTNIGTKGVNNSTVVIVEIRTPQQRYLLKGYYSLKKSFTID